MQKILFLVICSLVSFTFAQQINIRVNNFVGEKAVLASLEGEKLSSIDTISLSDEGKFEFDFNDIKNYRGFYRLSVDNKNWINFIFDNENVEIETDVNNIFDSLKVIKSESNKIYYSFVRLNKNYKTKTELLQLILSRYPKNDDYYTLTKEKLLQVQKEYLQFINVTSQTNPNSFIAKYIRSAQLPVADTNIPFEEQLTFLKTHALDNVNFYDEELIYSDVFTNKTIEYLTYYRNDQLPLELLEKEFIIAVDTILTKAKVNLTVYKYIVEYLISGFKKYGFDNVIDYIVENYVIEDDLCLDAKIESSIDRRITQARNFKDGNTVPNIISNDPNGKKIELNKINSEHILIVFYASWCPHCRIILSQISQLYKNQKKSNTEVFAVSIDTLKSDWLNYIETNNLNWINVSDLNGGNGKAVTDYYIYATPTMFLIDKQLILIAKPSSIDELSNWF